jgi:hypothetical protein
MSDKKNIDRLFQEKFKDFEVIPDEIVWKKIKARQNENKKRGVLVPFWYRVAGVAALITLIFGINSLLFNTNSQQQNNTITDSDTQNIIEQTKTTTPDKQVKPPTKNGIVTSEKKETNPVDQKTKNTTQNQDNNAGQHNYFESSITKENAVVNTLEQVPSKPQKGSELDPTSHSVTKNSIVSHPTTNNNNTTETSSKSKADSIVTQERIIKKAAIVDQQNKKPNLEKEYPLFITPNEKNNTNTQGLAKKNSDIKNKTLKEDVENLNDNGKKSIFDVINQKEEKEIAEESTSTKKWNIAPNVAPVYYSSIGGGSSIDSQFADNTKNGQVNMSYGMHISYAINKRFSVRSGVNKVDLSYNTEGVGFSPSAVGKNLENVSYNSTAGAILISDIGNVRNTADIGSEFSDINRNAIDQKQNPGLLNQSIAYLEVPLEMKYALVNKKIGVNMIGGISTLFLQDNEISIEAGDFEATIGEANNLNDVSFSGNIGLGVDYKISDQFEVNLEPIFKYQFNAFNDNADNFKPYYFGIYTGVSIRF